MNLLSMSRRTLVTGGKNLLSGSKTLIKDLRYCLHVIVRPFDGFWDLKYEKRGNLKTAFTLVFLLIASFIIQRQLTAFLFNTNNIQRLDIRRELAITLVPFFLWCVANWCLTTLMDGEGSFKDIIMATAYSLVPIIIVNILLTIISHGLTLEEQEFYNVIAGISAVWSGWLLFVGIMTVHQYSIKKTFFTILLTIVGMGIISFIGVLFFSLIQQMVAFVSTVYKELTLRLY